ELAVGGELSPRAARGPEQEPHPGVEGKRVRKHRKIVLRGLLGRDPDRPLKRDEDRIAKREHHASADEQDEEPEEELYRGDRLVDQERDGRRGHADPEKMTAPLGPARPDLFDGGLVVDFVVCRDVGVGDVPLAFQLWLRLSPAFGLWRNRHGYRERWCLGLVD